MRKANAGSQFSVLVPVEPWLRDQLNIIEDFAKQNANVGNFIMSSMNALSYKPLWPGQRMYIRVSQWCTILRRNIETGKYDSVKLDTPLGPGTYNLTIEVPYIYIGTHKSGEDFSLSLRITQIVFEPESERSVLIRQNEPQGDGHHYNNVARLQEVKA